MKRLLPLVALLLTFACTNISASENEEPTIYDTVKPFEACAPASRHALKVLDYIVTLLEYQGESITLCRATTVPTIAAWSKLVELRQHPYVKWKKEPITKPYISYNPLYLEQLEMAQGELITYAIMARHVGHHIKQHTNYLKPLDGLAPPPAQVAIADYFAGYFLAKQEIDPQHLHLIQQSIFALTEFPEATILEQRQRLLLQGWEKGGGQATTLNKPKIDQLW